MFCCNITIRSRTISFAYISFVGLEDIRKLLVITQVLLRLFIFSYTMGHIWACPPSEGDDYIFHCHPPEQKIPKPKRLQEWYKKMLDKAIIERVVIDYKVRVVSVRCTLAISSILWGLIYMNGLLLSCRTS